MKAIKKAYGKAKWIDTRHSRYYISAIHNVLCNWMQTGNEQEDKVKIINDAFRVEHKPLFELNIVKEISNQYGVISK